MSTVKLDPAKGVQIPNMTTTERDAVSSPETGAIIWNTTTSAVNQYNGSAWKEMLRSDGSAASLTAIPAGNLTGTVADARISALTASKLTGALPAISGASLTGLTSSQMPTGSVLQVVTGATSSQVTTTGTETDTGLTATITPSSTSNKILVMVAQMGLMKEGSSSNARMKINLYRGATNINSSDGNMWPFVNTNLRHGGFSIQNLDSPSTTSAVTYKTTLSGNDATNVYVQKDSNSGTSSIVLMEIAG